MSKRTIKLEFEVAAQRYADMRPDHSYDGNAMQQLYIRPLADQDFWDLYFDEETHNGYKALLNVVSDLSFEDSLAIAALRLHDIAAGKSFAHGVETEVPQEAVFHADDGKTYNVKVPKMTR